MHRQAHMYDAIGIGFGPSNIALAIALEELHIDLDIVYLEARSSTQWHPGMLYPGADIQNHPLRDLVTPRNPRSRYSFTNFLFEQGRLYEHLNLGMLFPLRAEYAEYVTWAASHFDDSVKYNSPVERLDCVPATGDIAAHYEVTCANGDRYLARSVVVAPGRTPYIPEVLCAARSDRVVHLNDYIPTLEKLRGRNSSPRIAVVGASQSAVEILLHLSEELPNANIVGISRRYGYRLKDTGPFTGEVYFPQFVDLFHGADKATKRRLRDDLHLTNYAASDADVLDRLYRRMYERGLLGKKELEVWRCADIIQAWSEGDGIALELTQIERGGTPRVERFDLVVSATGFRDIGTAQNQETHPAILNDIVQHLALDEDGCIEIEHDYQIASKAEPPIFLNGLCESSHGMGDAGSFSMLAIRSKIIATSLRQALRAASDPEAAAAGTGGNGLAAVSA